MFFLYIRPSLKFVCRHATDSLKMPPTKKNYGGFAELIFSIQILHIFSFTFFKKSARKINKYLPTYPPEKS